MKTLLMIKPDAVAERGWADIISIVLRNQFEITRLNMTHFDRARAEKFYDVHRERPFFGELVDYITSGPVVAIEIEDDGPGIPPDLQASIFYPLVTSRPNGTGLGLPAAQELLSRHGGMIEFESRPGRTVFIMRIPLNKPDVRNAGEAS